MRECVHKSHLNKRNYRRCLLCTTTVSFTLIISLATVMSQQKDLTVGDLSFEDQAELIKDIKKNVASLKLSIDRILVDMDSIRNSKVEILDKVSSVKDENVVNNAQLQVTLVRATRIIRKSEDNRRKLELVLKKMSDFNVIHTLTSAVGEHRDKLTDCQAKRSEKITDEDNTSTANVRSIKEKICLHLLDNNKYLLSAVEPPQRDELGKFKWGKDSALKELQWIMKMKMYKLRHHYDKLPYDHDLEERTPLPVSWTRRSSEQA